MAKKPRVAPAEEIVHRALATPTPPRVYTIDPTVARMEAAARAVDPVASDDLLASLAEMVTRAAGLERDLAEIEDMRAVRAARLRNLIEELIPAAMSEAGLASFKTAAGATVSVERVFDGTLGKGKDETPAAHEKRVAAAMEWLTENGHDGIIKVEFEVKLARGDSEADAAVREALTQVGVDFKRDEGVHSSTLKAFVRGQMVNGDPLPLDLFRVTDHTRAKITAPKEK
jgi:hypothetical protein